MATVEITADICTWLNQYAPDTNYGDGVYLRVGDALDSYSKSAHTLLHFPMDDIPAGSVINSVTLKVTQSSKEWASETTATSYILRMIRGWDEYQTTWNETDTGHQDPTYGVDWASGGATGADTDYATGAYGTWTRNSSDANGIKEITVDEALVQGWLDGTWENHGIRISGAAPSTASHKNATQFRSSQYTIVDAETECHPTLVVDYTPDSVPLCDADSLVVTNVTATTADVEFVITNDGDDALTAYGLEWNISGGGGEDSWDAGSHALLVEPLTVTHTITGLTEGTTYLVVGFATNDVGTGYTTPDTNSLFTTLDVSTKSGDGGTGLTSSITGTETGYAGGGGGASSVEGMAGLATQGGGRGGDGVTAAAAGTANTGGGGGGGVVTGAAGGKGVAILKYAIADAISATPQLANDVFKPSLAYHNGKLFAPYADPEGMTTVDISSVTSGTDTTINTSTAHGLEAGDVITISGTDVTPSINGIRTVKAKTDSDTFTIEDNTSSVATGTGTISYNHLVGYSHTGSGYNDGTIRTSRSSFHTGSLLKDYRYISVIHEPLPAGAAIQAAWTIDDTRTPATLYQTRDSSSTDRESRFTIADQGYEIDIELSITSDGSVSPRITGFNVVWDFVKIQKHQYSLDCRKGANNGRWGGDPEEALQFLFDAANQEATFEDRFNGEYTGTIEQVEYTQSAFSLSEGPSGLVKILVREVQ